MAHGAGTAGSRSECPLFSLLDLRMLSLRRGHANLLCIVPMLTDDPRRESGSRPLFWRGEIPQDNKGGPELCKLGVARCVGSYCVTRADEKEIQKLFRRDASEGIGRQGIVLKHRLWWQKGPIPCRPVSLLAYFQLFNMVFWSRENNNRMRGAEYSHAR